MASDVEVNLLFLIIGGTIGVFSSFLTFKYVQNRNWRREYAKDIYVPLKNEIEHNREHYLTKVDDNFDSSRLKKEKWTVLKHKGYDLILDKDMSRDIHDYYRDLDEYNDLNDETGKFISTTWESCLDYIGSFKNTMDHIDPSYSNQFMNLLINSLRFKRILGKNDNKKQFRHILMNDSKYDDHMLVLKDYFPNLRDYYNQLDVDEFTDRFLELREKLTVDSDKLTKELTKKIVSAFE